VERWVGLLGIATLLGVAYASSTNRRAIVWRPIWVALLLQLSLAWIALRTPVGTEAFRLANLAAAAFISAADAGIDFLFGRWPEAIMGASGEPVHVPYSFAVRVLPILVFMSSVFSVLFHFEILPRIVSLLARSLRHVMRISGAESLATIANVFLGMTEAPLMIRPYMDRLTRSELFCVMTAGLATVAGTVLVAYMGMVGPEFAGHLAVAGFLSAPAAIAIAKIMVPEEGVPESLGHARIHFPRETVNAIDAAASGAIVGVQLAIQIGAMLIAFVAIVYMIDAGVARIGAAFGFSDASLASLLGRALAPLAWLLGVRWEDAASVGQLLGVKTVLNEFLAFQMLSEGKDSLAPRSVVIASYALCGFANLGSLAILIGGLGGIAPGRRHDVARDSVRALVAGSLATFLTGAVAGILFRG
jgi:CNT family concentrative nucleoside transporter